ncbi:unnamed protein product [Closterium sp. NIES-54]
MGVRPLLDLESLGRTLLLMVVLALGVVRLVLWIVVLGLPPLRTLLLPPTPTRLGTRPVFAVPVGSSCNWSERRESWNGSSWSYSGWRSSTSSSCSSSSSSNTQSRSSRTSSRTSSSSSSSCCSHLLLLSLVFGPSVSPLLLLPPPPLLLSLVLRFLLLTPPPLLPLSPPLSHTWPSCRSPRARPSSPIPFTDLRTALFCSSPPHLSPSVLPSPPESALTASLSTPATDYYRTYCPVLSRVLASLVTDPRASLSFVSALTAPVTEFASTRCLDYATSLVAAPPTSPLAIGAYTRRSGYIVPLPSLALSLLGPSGGLGDRSTVSVRLLKRHTCTDLGEMRHYLGLQITRDRAARTITLSQSHMVQQVLQQFELQHSTIQRTPLAVDHRLTGPFPDEPFEPSGPYAELVGCLMVGKYLAMTSGMGLVLGGRLDVVLTVHCDSSYADDPETHRSTQGYCFSLGSGAVSCRSTHSSSVSTSTAEAEIYARAMAAQELRWLTFLLTFFCESCRGVDRLVSTLLSPWPTLHTSSPRPCRLVSTRGVVCS